MVALKDTFLSFCSIEYVHTQAQIAEKYIFCVFQQCLAYCMMEKENPDYFSLVTWEWNQENVIAGKIFKGLSTHIKSCKSDETNNHKIHVNHKWTEHYDMFVILENAFANFWLRFWNILGGWVNCFLKICMSCF